MKSFKDLMEGGTLDEAMGGKRNMNFEGTDQIGDFWVVTDPSRMQEATMSDIAFQADVFDMHLQMNGGLKGSDIIGLYKSEAKAKKIAQKLLDLDAKKRKIK